MDGLGWQPVDFIVGGMLTAGVAFGVYKLGLNNGAGSGGRPMQRSINSGVLSCRALRECIAFAGRPSELEVAGLPQSDPMTQQLAASLASSIFNRPNSNRLSPTKTRSDVKQRKRQVPQRHHSADSTGDYGHHLYDEAELEDSVDQMSPRRRRRLQIELSPPQSGTTPPRVNKQLQSYRDTMDKWITDSELKMEKIEHQRMSLTTELQVMRETLQAERRLRTEAEQQRHRVEIKLQEAQSRLSQRREESERESWRAKEVAELERQVRDLEEQLEGLYRHNVVTPRQTAQMSAEQQQELRQELQEAQDRLQRNQQDMLEMENDITNLSAQLNKARKDSHQLAEDNAHFQMELLEAQRAARSMAEILVQESKDDKKNCEELVKLLNSADTDVKLARLLQCIAAVIFQKH